MTKEFKEFPKALYRNGEHATVENEEAEETMRKDGWTDWHGDYKAMKAAVKKAEKAK